MYGRTGEKQQSPVLYPILLKLPSTQAQLRRRDTFLTAPLKNTKGKNKPQRTFFCISLCGFEGRSERKGTRQAGRSFLSARRRGTDHDDDETILSTESFQQLRSGFKNRRHGTFPWRGGVPPFSVNFFPLGFWEPTVRGGGGGTPLFR